MSIEFKLKQQGAGVQAKGGNVVAAIGPCSAGPTLQGLTFDPGQNPVDTVGYGAVVESTRKRLASAGQRSIICATENTEWGDIGAVTESPSGPGPTIVVNLNDDATGPYDNYLLAVRVDRAGALGIARFAIALDGSSFGYSTTPKPPPPAQYIGSVDLTKLDTTTLNSLTVIARNETDTMDRTTTFTSPANPAAVVAALTAVYHANGDHMAASLVAGRYLKIASTVGGASSSLTLSGTALTTLGIVAGTYAGSASTYQIEGTNLVLEFPATSPYVAGTVYTSVCTGPRFALEDALNAAEVLRAGYQTKPFALIEITQPCADGHDLRTWVDAFAARMLEWRAGDFPVIARVAIAGPLGATGPAGIAANDLDVSTAMEGERDDLVIVPHADVYAVGQSVIGSFRRSPVSAFTERFAGNSLSEDPGNAQFGPLDGYSLQSPDYDEKAGTGVLARDENQATLKMGGSDGPGFTVLKMKPDGLFFMRGVTRAGSASLFVDTGVEALGVYASGIVLQLLRSVENTTCELDAEGKMKESERAALEDTWTGTLTAFTVGQGHASSAKVTIAQDVIVKGPFAKTLRATFDVQERGQLEHIIGTLSIDGIINLSAAAS